MPVSPGSVHRSDKIACVSGGAMTCSAVPSVEPDGVIGLGWLEDAELDSPELGWLH